MIVVNKKSLILGILFGLFLLVPTAVRAQVVVEKSTEIITISDKQYYMHHVKRGETLYGISKAYQVTEEEILRLNPEINDLGLQAEMVIGIPVVTNEPQTVTPLPSGLPITDDDEFGEGYIIHTVKEMTKTRHLVKDWNVDETEFRRLNPSVGSYVFVGQTVLIPMAGVHPKDSQITENQVVQIDSTVVVNPNPVEEDTVLVEQPVECVASAENKARQYRVALLVPLYLNEIEKLDLAKDKIEKTKNARALKFLQFYEGFMMAVDSLTEHCGLRLDLTVIDVNENVAGANAAVNQLQNESVDMIVGPFFSKSFAVVQEYALQHNIMIVNPLSERESILADAPNVVKLKPCPQSMVAELAELIRQQYPKAKVTLLVENGKQDDEIVNAVDRMLGDLVAREVQLSNAEIHDLIIRESQRRKMGKRVLSTLEVEGQVFSTKMLSENPDGVVYFDNPYQRLTLSDADVNVFKNGLSSARDNVLVAYGEDVVFATKILNNINKSTQKFPITLIGLPNWEQFDNLLVENLLNMNAIYFDDHFVDYNDSVVLKFVDDFRLKYESEPMDYAFQGFDVGWYFLNYLMQFGTQSVECLQDYHLPLFGTRYYFDKRRSGDGLENRYWNIYQYDSQTVELKPIMIHQEEE